MYDILPEKIPDLSGKPSKPVELRAAPELADLSAPEISFDLQSFIESSGQTPTEEGLFADILAEDPELVSDQKSALAPAPSAFSMPHSAGFGADRYAAEAGVKQEPQAGIASSFVGGAGNFALTRVLGAGDAVFAAAQQFGADPRDQGAHDGGKRAKKAVDKGTEEYRRRRERNNIAVRKSREKAKQRCRDTERRVCDLVSENVKLKKRVELLSKELSVLKNLLANVGVGAEQPFKSKE